ncbi:hypothetical protein LTR17_025645 [Elasticomyces elasticus]|nr:hypothetical protein LTR17_025645 [Elasticomyces elasticus]
MDPLSLTASIIAVLQLCGTTIKAFQVLREINHTLPGRLDALQEEVTDLGDVLQDVAEVQEERAAQLLAARDHIAHLPALLQHATGKLLGLQRMLQSLSKASTASRIGLLQANSWRKNHGRLKALQDDIKGIKTNLNLLLGASHSRDLVTVRLQAEIILAETTAASHRHRDVHDDLRVHMSDQRAGRDNAILLQTRIDERLQGVEQSLQRQEARLYSNQLKQLDPDMGRIVRQRARAAREQQGNKSSLLGGARRDAIGIRLTRQVGFCRRDCPCVCHKQRSVSTPSAIDRWLGQLSVEFSGIPMINVKCDNDSCERSQAPQVSMEYWFPLGFLWSQIIRLRMGYQPNIGPQLQLSMLRRVPDSAPAIDFAMKGNVKGLQDLFRRGLASPRDVSSTRGYTMLRWAMYAKQYETCRFLLYAGADPDYRPVSPYDNSPRNKANDFILQGGLSREAEEIYRQIATGSDYIDEQNYTPLHKAEDLIKGFPDIEKADYICRTPLSWAACRVNERDIVLLPAHGADPNTVDAQLSSPVYNAADRGHTTCVRLLLEAHGDPDPIRPGVSKGSLLNCASRNANDPLLLKTLLDFGADIDASGVDGITPMIHVARRDHQTPLTTAITHNSHHVLQLLLDRWYEYSECPRLKGPHMLPLVAVFADVETMSILASTDHVRLSYDPAYRAQDHIKALESRHDASDKLIAAFRRLLQIIDYKEELLETTEGGRLESGRAADVYADALAVAGAEPEHELDEAEGFEDALESWPEV